MDEVVDGERGPRTGYGIKMGALGWLARTFSLMRCRWALAW
jgi:hypothetical protein